MKRFLGTPVPLYLAALVLLAGAAVAAVFVERLRENVYQYDVFLRGSADPAKLEFGSWPALENAEFFNEVRSRFVTQNVSFIEANLSEMRIRVYRNGAVLKEVPIRTKGREGSWWETPAGLYKIDGKEKDHFSAFAGVHMPWSMPFEGNFFIHGWPYYPDGTPVDSRYSGGCIRLSTEDAKAVYDLAETGTLVLVYESDTKPDAFAYAPRVTGVSAAQYLAADLRNDFLFVRQDEKTPVPIASIAKFVTALVAVEYVNIEHAITADSRMIVPTSKPRLAVGGSYSLFSLLHPLLMESSNEAAEAIAGLLGRERFISLMNKKAKAIGMEHTAFVDPSGRGDDNTASAEDLYALAKHLLTNRSFLLRMSAGKIDERTYGPVAFRGLENFNAFGGDPAFLGGKIGKSVAAGETMVAIFDDDVGGTKRPMVYIVLGSSSAAADVARMRAWVRTTYAAAQ